MPKPDLQGVPSYYHDYIKLVPQQNLSDAFAAHATGLLSFLLNMPEAKWDYRYAEGKWNIKEMVQHIIDTERIFAYRALAIARGEQSPLPGFDENAYASASGGAKREKEHLLEELAAVQKSTALLFQSFDEGQLQVAGIANGKLISVNAIGFITIGHGLHHQNVLQQKYL